MGEILSPMIEFTGTTLQGQEVDRLTRRLGDVREIFQDKQALSGMAADQKIYDVASYFPVAEGTLAGLFFGITYIQPGKVGDEYFMTKGHFHSLRDRAEIYHCIEGEGMLILMDEKRHTWAERMYPGSLHYINGHIAHRTANTGPGILIFSAIWPSDAGHDLVGNVHYAPANHDHFRIIRMDQVDDTGCPHIKYVFTNGPGYCIPCKRSRKKRFKVSRLSVAEDAVVDSGLLIEGLTQAPG